MVNMRAFNQFEQRNLQFLVNHNIKYTLVEITPTGLKKGILDSTAPMRTYFIDHNIHNYEEQLQGPENKVIKEAIILTGDKLFNTRASFYRPNTKKGDPRMWIYGLGAYSTGNDIHTLIWFENKLYCVNITRFNIEEIFHSDKSSPLQEILNEIYQQSNSVSEELLSKFRSVKGKWFESEVTADTGIGRTIESFLGISMNSDKTPDYKGIELKSHRDKRSSKKNVLFTQTPNWDISALKSGKQIVEKYGYIKQNVKTYQNTVCCSTPNSQNLFLNVNEQDNLLELQAKEKKIVDVAAWQLQNLHNRLMIKHHETFWIEVENEIIDNKEYFRYKQILHTRNPNVGQFDILLEQDLITVDLLLSRPSGHGDTYSFKIKSKGMPLLFPESLVYVI